METAEELVGGGGEEGGGGRGASRSRRGGDEDDGDRSDYTLEDEGITPPTDSFRLVSRLHGRCCGRPAPTALP